MSPDADAIAACVFSTFEQLPQKRRPRPRSDGAREWVPLAGIVLVKDGQLACVSLGTGMKCLPSSKLPLANGNILHDWHAEVLALRSFNRFLLDECHLLSTLPYPSSQYIRQRPPIERTETELQPFTFREDVEIHMYCSEAPCGDASMELIMQAQDDATPWTSPLSVVTGTSDVDRTGQGEEPLAVLRGRSHFGHLGAVRCKPSRPDAPITLSKSCTDKLALTQATSVLSSLTSLLVSPRNAYLKSLVLPDSQLVPSACERAFSGSGRMSGVTQDIEKTWRGGYAWRGFEVRGTQREFAWSKRSVGVAEKAMASNISAVWTPSWQETLIGGVLQGRKQFDPRGASRICRRSLWKSVLEIVGLVGMPALVDAVRKANYGEVKGEALLDARKLVKEDMRREALKGWVRNIGDDGFGIEQEG
ncbi:adenosine deaminase/editase [Massariosphaeria phaeospora]|uniref:Adenosine deaminase/editase n=1 Tax=Massariosphaeria phaeospora TaxID=100035 RepID=A0A7C8IIZ5_9PLEO|nr:adenosine deaminase/editase [Massariosphaeria phaeospora]